MHDVESGQVDGRGLRHFVPVPEVSSLAELDEMVEQWGRQDDARRIGSRGQDGSRSTSHANSRC